MLSLWARKFNFKMKIYQIYHNEESKKQCSKGEFIEPLNVGDMAISQLAEVRAFFYAALYNYDDYVGFTTYKHNTKLNKCLII